MSDDVELRGLVISYRMGRGQAPVRALDGVDLDIAAGDSLAIVGESGSGKSTLGMAIGRLLAPNAQVEAGDVRIGGHSALSCTPDALRRLRREKLGIVYQNPMAALDPTMRVGRQVALALGAGATRADVEALLDRVGLPDAAQTSAKFPHELSGGMAQRVVIAQAIARRPAILIADEPTASLDASVQGVILDLLTALRATTGASLVLMSHDLHMVTQRCERLAVMYGGRIIETGASGRIASRPRHPYTRALIRAAAGNERPGQKLLPIPGVPPVLKGAATGCTFAPRCGIAQARCLVERPAERSVDGRTVACHFAAEDLAHMERALA